MKIVETLSVEEANILSPTPDDMLIIDASNSESELCAQFARAAFPQTPIILLMRDSIKNSGIADTGRLPPSLDTLLLMVGLRCCVRGPQHHNPLVNCEDQTPQWHCLAPRERNVPLGAIQRKAEKLIAAAPGLSEKISRSGCRSVRQNRSRTDK